MPRIFDNIELDLLPAFEERWSLPIALIFASAISICEAGKRSTTSSKDGPAARTSSAACWWVCNACPKKNCAMP